jgi:hypothetical protein
LTAVAAWKDLHLSYLAVDPMAICTNSTRIVLALSMDAEVEERGHSDHQMD